MGASADIVREDTKLWKEWYACSRALGFGEVPGKYSLEELRAGYNAILQGLEGFEEQSLYQKRRQSAHVIRHFLLLEFEVSSQALLTRFSPNILNGMTKKDYHNLFLKYSAKHPETILAKKDREKALERLVSCGIARREWFDISKIAASNI